MGIPEDTIQVVISVGTWPNHITDDTTASVLGILSQKRPLCGTVPKSPQEEGGQQRN